MSLLKCAAIAESSDLERSTDSAEALSNEQAWWSDWHADATAPAGLSDAESAIYDQSLTFLKMAQVTEEGDSYGQIPASFPASAAVGEFQHQWNITWVRDQAYAIAAQLIHDQAPEGTITDRLWPNPTGQQFTIAGTPHARLARWIVCV